MRDDLVAKGGADMMYEIINRPVTCRCGTQCVVKMFENQWFINYGDAKWKELAVALNRQFASYDPIASLTSSVKSGQPGNPTVAELASAVTKEMQAEIGTQIQVDNVLMLWRDELSEDKAEIKGSRGDAPESILKVDKQRRTGRRGTIPLWHHQCSLQFLTSPAADPRRFIDSDQLM